MAAHGAASRGPSSTSSVPARVVRLLPEAEAEVIANERWYARRSPSIARALITEVNEALIRIAESADIWPRYRRGTRRCVLRRFPFSIVYGPLDSRLPADHTSGLMSAPHGPCHLTSSAPATPFAASLVSIPASGSESRSRCDGAKGVTRREGGSLAEA